MQSVAGPLSEPFFQLRVLMRPVVIQHEMNIQIRFDGRVDLIQETKKLLMTVFGLALADYGSFRNIERGEQCGCSMSLVIVCLSFRKSGPQRKNGLCPVQGLNLALRIRAQHDRFVRRFRYRPTMSSTLLANSGSLLNLKFSTRCGCSLCFFQIRCTVAGLTF